MDGIETGVELLPRDEPGGCLLTGQVVPGVKAAALVDPTGCGDAYRAGLLYGIAHGWDWPSTGRLGAVMGAIKIAQRGAQNHSPSREEIEARVDRSAGLDAARAIETLVRERRAVSVRIGGEPRVIGMLTDRDVCMAALFQGKPLHELKVADAMSRDIRVSKTDDRPEDVELLMREQQIRRVPVTDEAGALV